MLHKYRMSSNRQKEPQRRSAFSPFFFLQPRGIVSRHAPLSSAAYSFSNVSIFERLISPAAQQNILAAAALNNECQNWGIVCIKNADFMFNASISD